MTHSANRPWLPTFTLTALLAVVFALAVNPVVASTGPCATAAVEEEFLLPDGSLHPAGHLTLCLGTEFTPVTRLYPTFVDRMAVGTFQGHRIQGDGENGHHMMFERNANGRLRLAGYTRPKSVGGETILLNRPGHVRVRHAMSQTPPGTQPADAYIRLATVLN